MAENSNPSSESTQVVETSESTTSSEEPARPRPKRRRDLGNIKRDIIPGGTSPASSNLITPPRRTSTVPIKGSPVMDGQTEDIFVPTASQTHLKVRQRSISEQIKEYSLGAVGSAVYTAVSSNADENTENGVGAGLQKALLNQITESMADTPDIMSPQFREIVREIVQGALQAAKNSDIRIQDVIKFVVTGIMAVAPHDEDPKMMCETLKIVASEVIYGKLSVGYSMKLASYALGGALFMLSIYFKNYQKKVEYTRQLDQKLKYACNDGIWEATGEITQFSEEHARANTDRFVAGRIEEEKEFQRNLVRSIFLAPIKKIERIPFVRNLMIKFKK